MGEIEESYSETTGTRNNIDKVWRTLTLMVLKIKIVLKMLYQFLGASCFITASEETQGKKERKNVLDWGKGGKLLQSDHLEMTIEK